MCFPVFCSYQTVICFPRFYRLFLAVFYYFFGIFSPFSYGTFFSGFFSVFLSFFCFFSFLYFPPFFFHASVSVQIFLLFHLYSTRKIPEKTPHLPSSHMSAGPWLLRLIPQKTSIQSPPYPCSFHLFICLLRYLDVSFCLSRLSVFLWFFLESFPLLSFMTKASVYEDFTLSGPLFSFTAKASVYHCSWKSPKETKKPPPYFPFPEPHSASIIAIASSKNHQETFRFVFSIFLFFCIHYDVLSCKIRLQ